MRGSRFRYRPGGAWWWVFGLLVAAPAVALALLGFGASRADEIDRRQRLADRQAQVARLADAALATALDRIEAEASRAPTDDLTPVEIDAQGIVTFHADRVYFGRMGIVPRTVSLENPSPEAVTLADQADAARFQGRARDARALYQELRSNAALSPWAALQIAALDASTHDAGWKAVADPRFATTDARAPSGIPLAIVASGYSIAAAPRDRPAFTPLITASLRSLRSGRWWLGVDARRAYDAELRRWLAAAGPSRPIDDNDVRIDRLSTLEPLVRASFGQGSPARADLAGAGASRALILWRPSTGAGRSWTGAVLLGERVQALFNDALSGLLREQELAVVVTDRRGETVWGGFGAPAGRIEPLEAFAGWKLTFARTPPSTPQYALVLLPIGVLAVGLMMTLWIVRREFALAGRQANFVAAVTHEFKSPITSIRLFMERIAGGRVDGQDASARYYAAINDETDRLEALVNRLLESQKLRSGQKDYTFRLVSLADSAGAALARVRRLAEAKQIGLDLHTKAGTPNLRIDYDAVTDAIANLLDNAIKYSPAGSRVALELSAGATEATLDVIDQGIGVESADAERIFDPFYRSRRGDHENVHGTGLGLALVKATMDAHGGSVDVASDGRRGSRFTLRFPLAEER